MSHFSVFVIGEPIDSQLDPYWELDLPQDVAKEDPRAEFNVEVKNSDLEKYYKDFFKGRNKYEEEYEQQIKDYRSMSDEMFRIKWDITNKKYIPTLEHLEEHRKVTQEYMKEYINPESLIREFESYQYDEKEDGWGYYSNPNAKWDWYSIGGRWSGILPGKNGEKLDTARLKELNVEKIIENPPFAIVKGGIWFEKGDMGWFGMTHSEKKDTEWINEVRAIFEGIDPEDFVTVVDCHI